MRCTFLKSGPSYQTSPTRMSILPSRLTSATATPSERNALSMTIFCQPTGVVVGFSSAAGDSGPPVSRSPRQPERSARKMNERGMTNPPEPDLHVVGLWTVVWGVAQDSNPSGVRQDRNPGPRAASPLFLISFRNYNDERLFIMVG